MKAHTIIHTKQNIKYRYAFRLPYTYLISWFDVRRPAWSLRFYFCAEMSTIACRSVPFVCLFVCRVVSVFVCLCPTLNSNAEITFSRSWGQTSGLALDQRSIVFRQPLVQYNSFKKLSGFSDSLQWHIGSPFSLNLFVYVYVFNPPNRLPEFIQQWRYGTLRANAIVRLNVCRCMPFPRIVQNCETITSRIRI